MATVAAARRSCSSSFDSDVDVGDRRRHRSQARSMLRDADCLVVDDALPDFSAEDVLDAIAERQQVSPAAGGVCPQRASRAHACVLEPRHGSFALREARSLERAARHLALLPASQPGRHVGARAPRSRHAAQPSQDSEGKKALIVDDDMRNIFALATVLDEHGMVIVSADNGRDAIRLVEADPAIDIVLMDIMMPEMDGMATMQRDPQAAARPRAADHRGDGQGDEGRPREVHRGRRLGLPVQAGRSHAPAGGAAGLAVPLTGHRCIGLAMRCARATSCSADGGHADCRPEKVDILIVDDLPEKLLVFKTVLEELGQNLVIVSSGAEALREVLKREFAVILLDVNMPDIDGFETAALIRQLQALGAHADHLHHRLRRRDADRARLLAGRGRLHPVAGRARGAAHQGARVRRAALLQRRIARQADERVALAAAEAALLVAEESTRRSAFLSELSHALSGLLDVRTGMQQAAVDGGAGAGAGRDVALVDAQLQRAIRRRLGAPATAAATDYDLGDICRAPNSSACSTRCSRGSRCRDLGATLAYPLRDGPARCSACITLVAASPPRSARRCSKKWPRARPSRSPPRSCTRTCSRDRGAPRSRGAARGGQPAQGRVPRDAVARAAQPAGADPQRGRDHPPARRPRRQADAGPPTSPIARCAQLTRLVDELLDVARISQGKIVLQTAPLELTRAGRAMRRDAAPGARSRAARR